MVFAHKGDTIGRLRAGRQHTRIIFLTPTKPGCPLVPPWYNFIHYDRSCDAP